MVVVVGRLCCLASSPPLTLAFGLLFTGCCSFFLLLLLLLLLKFSATFALVVAQRGAQARLHARHTRPDETWRVALHGQAARHDAELPDSGRQVSGELRFDAISWTVVVVVVVVVYWR